MGFEHWEVGFQKKNGLANGTGTPPSGPPFNVFQQRSSFALSTTIRSRNEPMAKPLTSWLVPSLSQHNLHLVVSGRRLHVSVTKFHDKFAEINFKYVVQTHISRAFVNFTALRPREYNKP